MKGRCKKLRRALRLYNATIHHIEHVASNGDGAKANKGEALYEENQIARIVAHQAVDTRFFIGAPERFVLKKAQDI